MDVASPVQKSQAVVVKIKGGNAVSLLVTHLFLLTRLAVLLPHPVHEVLWQTVLRQTRGSKAARGVQRHTRQVAALPCLVQLESPRKGLN